MLSLPKRVSTAATLIAFASVLGGCVTGTEVAYSEYRFDRYGGTERTYEHNLYSDPANDIESERCRIVVRRRINTFGDEVVRRNRVCDPQGQTYAEQTWNRHGAYPQGVYPDPVEAPLPPADVPDANGTEVVGPEQLTTD